MSLVSVNADESVASRKLAAAELRRARKAARDPRNRLFSDSSDEIPRGILKNARVPTKRSASECVDDLSQIMADLDLNINDFSNGKFCPRHHFFKLEEEEEHDADRDEDDDDQQDDDDDDDDVYHDYDNDKENSVVVSKDQSDTQKSTEKKKKEQINSNLKRCDCNHNPGDSDNNGKPKKSVRFDDHVHETFFFASRLYDRRNFAKYHFSSRHHPPPTKQGKRGKKSSKNSSKSDHSNKVEQKGNSSQVKNDQQIGCKLTKSQRAKQSKKDKKKRLNGKEEVTDTSSDDQGYCSSMHSFSD